MLIHDIMRRDPAALSPAATLAEMLALLQRRGIRHIPIVEGQKLVGIVSDRDIKSALLSVTDTASGPARDRLLHEIRAATVMAPKVVTIAPVSPVEEAARLMLENRISALPVTDQQRLVGIVTETDVLRMLVRAMGVTEPSSRIDVTLNGRPGGLSDVVTTVEGAGLEICSLMTLADADGHRAVALRVPTIDPRRAIRALEAKGYSVSDSWRGSASARSETGAP
jgi:acetoin utilization protein AcuB